MIRPLLLAAAFWAACCCGGALAQESAPDDLPFKRTVGVDGTIAGSLGSSAVAAGVPAEAMAEALRALGSAIDLDRGLHDGDRFYVRYERTFSLDGTPADNGRVLWAEVRPAAKKAAPVAVYRFKPLGAAHDDFWLANGRGTAPPQLRLPLDTYVLSSGFGLRVDPLDQPPLLAQGIGLDHTIGKNRTSKGHDGSLPPGLVSGPGGGGLSGAPVNVATPLGLSLGLAPGSSTTRLMTATRGLGARHGAMALHEGVDLVAPYGTPILAAGDGVVKGAEPKGRYGNWIEIDHEGDLATVYGHLSSFAAGIAPGTRVSRGDVIGYIGLTGRTTGAHVHFEVRFKGRPVNAMVYSALKPAQLRGPDLDHLRKLVARDQAERELEAKAQLSAGL
ncbi:MAG: M23 family metallopeptidase [Proteobacteria bacterium]|nr:M23 family metallopeptidase [Pseudomonadota bacterium]